MAAMFGPERCVHEMQISEARRKEVEVDLVPLYTGDTYASCREQLVHAVDSARANGRIPVSNEHWFNLLHTDEVLEINRGNITSPDQLGSNPTYMPDELFHTLRPIILIRHPIHSVNSIYRSALKVTQQRPGDEDFDMITRNQPLRLLFDYFRQHRNQTPVVVDGDDILWRTDAISVRLNEALGLRELSETWEPTSAEQIKTMNPLVYKLTEDIQLSRGIQRPEGGQPGEPDIEKAVADWTEKYGEVVADQLRGFAEDNMPHYEYLKGFKI